MSAERGERVLGARRLGALLAGALAIAGSAACREAPSPRGQATTAPSPAAHAPTDAPTAAAAEAPPHRPPRCAPPSRSWPALPASVSPLWRRLEADCNRGEAAACGALGAHLFHGTGGPEDASRALSLLHGACESGLAASCTDAADAYLLGLGAPADMDCAEALLSRGCGGGDRDGCVELGNRLLRGEGLRHAPARGRALLEKACPGAPDGACRPSRRGRVRPSAADGTACAGGDYAACERLSLSLPDERAYPLLSQSCGAGSSEGCWALRRIRGRPHDVHATWKTACQRGVLAACDEILHPELQPSSKVPPPPLAADERAAFRRQACDHGSARACREIAEAMGPTTEAIALLSRACPPLRVRLDGRDIDPVACRLLGDHYRAGAAGADEGERVVGYYRAACHYHGRVAARDEKACVALAEIYERGEIVPRDEERAQDVRAGLCSVGSEHCRGFPKCSSFGLACDPSERGDGGPTRVEHPEAR